MSRATAITGPLAALVERAGGVSELAREWGVARSTLHRWGTGEQMPGAMARRAANEWARRRQLPEPFPG